MNVFPSAHQHPEYSSSIRYHGQCGTIGLKQLNTRLGERRAADLTRQLHSILTVTYTSLPLQLMLQFYLRAEQLELSWIGSGRFIGEF